MGFGLCAVRTGDDEAAGLRSRNVTEKYRHLDGFRLRRIQRSMLYSFTGYTGLGPGALLFQGPPHQGSIRRSGPEHADRNL